MDRIYLPPSNDPDVLYLRETLQLPILSATTLRPLQVIDGNKKSNKIVSAQELARHIKRGTIVSAISKPLVKKFHPYLWCIRFENTLVPPEILWFHMCKTTMITSTFEEFISTSSYTSPDYYGTPIIEPSFTPARVLVTSPSQIWPMFKRDHPDLAVESPSINGTVSPRKRKGIVLSDTDDSD